MAESEAILLTRYARERDPEAFRALIKPHENMVFAVCTRILGDRTDAEDAVQECFFALVRSADRLTAPIAGWLHTVAVSRAVDMLRRRSVRQAREEAARRRRPPRADPSWPEIRSHVDAAIEELPEGLKAPLVMYYLEGRTQEEVSAELGVSQPAVSVRLKRALEALRHRLRKAGVSCPAAVLAPMLASGGAEATPPTLTAALGKMALAGVATGRAAGSAIAGGAVCVCVLGAGLVLLIWVLYNAAVGLGASLYGVRGPAAATVVPAPGPGGPYGGSRADGAPLQGGAVVERVLSGGQAGEDMFLDLDSGRLLSLPPDVAEFDRMITWMRKAGADVLYERSLSADSVIGVDMAVASLSDEAARTAATAELLQFVGPGAVLRASALMSTKPRLPRSYAFRTREGHVGVLQIVQFDGGQHRGLRIRYRIAGPGAAESGAGRSPA